MLFGPRHFDWCSIESGNIRHERLSACNFWVILLASQIFDPLHIFGYRLTGGIDVAKLHREDTPSRWSRIRPLVMGHQRRILGSLGWYANLLDCDGGWRLPYQRQFI